ATRAEAITETIARLTTNIEALAARSRDAKKEADQASVRRKTATDRHERVTRALRDREDLARLDQEFAEAEQQLKELDKQVEDTGVELRRRRDEVAAHEKLVADFDGARKALDEVERAAAALLELEALQKRIDTEQNRRMVLLEQRGQLDA